MKKSISKINDLLKDRINESKDLNIDNSLLRLELNDNTSMNIWIESNNKKDVTISNKDRNYPNIEKFIENNIINW